MQSTAAPDVFATAAAFLLARLGQVEDQADSDISAFLRLLGLDQLSTAGELLNAAALLRAAGRFGGIFRLHCRSAPGLTFFGGFARPDATWASQIEPVSLNGAGETSRQAFGACIGEGIEYLSQFGPLGKKQREGSIGEAEGWSGPDSRPLLVWLASLDLETSPIEWVKAIRLRDSGTAWLPSRLAVRTAGTPANDEVRLAVASGCAAGPNWETALRAALFEAVERDAVAMWWRGGRAARSIPLETLLRLGAVDFLSRIRRGVRDRFTTLLALPCDFGLACIAAVSFDREGRRFAGGYACHADPVFAVRAAIRELCQMELGNDLIAVKLSRAPVLNEWDRSHRRRQTEIDCDDPRLVPRSIADLEAGDMVSAEADMAKLIERLGSTGFEAYAFDLSREEFGVHVAKVVVPGLQPYPSTFRTSRLAAEVAKNNSPDATDVDLF